MSDETPDTENVEEEAPKPARRRSRKKAAEEAPEATSSSETTSNVSDEDATPEAEAAEVEETPDDVAAEEATEVVLEADDEAEEEPESEVETEDAEPDAEAEEEPGAEAEAPKPRRRRRRQAEPEEEPPSAPAPTRRRGARDPSLPIPVVRAQAKYVRSSARKARLVCDNIRGRNVEDARAILANTPRAVARDWSKLLESAIANAEHNHELVGEDLYVKAVHADEGPTIRRFRPRAMGRATKIRKRTSHLTILLTPKE
jgi:ribosomal protein L22